MFYNIHFYDYSEEDEEVTDEMKSFTCVTNKSELVDGHLKETTFSLPKQQNFVGKIGVLYENYKCNITQAWSGESVSYFMY